MIKKVTLLFVLLELSIQLGSAQDANYELSYSSPYSDDDKALNVRAVHVSDSGNIIFLKTGKKVLAFDVFNSNGIHVFNKEIKISAKENYIGAIFHENKLKVLTVEIEKKEKKNHHAYIIWPDDLEYEKKFIFSMDLYKDQKEVSYLKHNDQFALSPNEKYLAIYNNKIDRSNNTFELRVFDLELKQSYFQQSQKIDERTYELTDLAVDNEGNAYIVGRLFDKGQKERKGGEVNFSYVLNKVDREKVTSKELDFGENLVSDLDILNVSNNIHLVGFAWDRKKFGKDGVEGLMLCTLSKDKLEIISTLHNRIPRDIYNDIGIDFDSDTFNFFSWLDQRSKEGFFIDKILSDTEGNTFVIAEQIYEQTSVDVGGVNMGSVNSGSVGFYGTTNQSTTIYGDLMIFRFNSDGKLVWARGIEKHNLYPSYNAFLNEGKLHVLLNSFKGDKKRDKGNTNMRSASVFESSSLYDVSYDLKGIPEYHKILDYKTFNYLFIPAKGEFKNGKFVMLNNDRYSRQFLILTAKQKSE